MDASDLHIPVMLERTLELLAPAIARAEAAGRAPLVIDGTLGMGGHTEAMLAAHPSLRVAGIDRDPDAIRLAGERLARFGDRFVPVQSTYDRIDLALEAAGAARADGILLDLGVSSLQLDDAERGFAYAKDAPLDMRMGQSGDVTAATILAERSDRELARLFRVYGDEKLADRYARAIVAARAEAPIETSARLVDILQAATPRALANQGHPAKRVFQALRIEVNQELAILERTMPAAIDALGVGGRLVVLAYQSLEDRVVKRALQAASSSTAPRDLPVELPEHAPHLRLLVRGAELADEAERARNPRSAPVRLRAAERIRPASNDSTTAPTPREQP
ncbi:16S rRNA (cytosine(1402)-N(4))-methyltransferase RsmH [Agrococcus sp. Marseille-Q4369]|uniref:16S rRNA (cytosine(1402)-N(4))-methyltransferase RsmH n=1 Tax=Agrococcus sp. Marseille-Q4369 TaxID=2810513 RepID=UPI001B8C48DB|nr:16S rRNA (cytosine(1402)-N(4))-methyltransferase RsmH [Agrococcus sp. Marseille-Q4369]QUW19459.1 16S rRNA (cytosine(1402)-N(4))-methyltransferase RsmH [Agrococcus sp. Marseille-Q4369]